MEGSDKAKRSNRGGGSRIEEGGRTEEAPNGEWGVEEGRRPERVRERERDVYERTSPRERGRSKKGGV